MESGETFFGITITLFFGGVASCVSAVLLSRNLKKLSLSGIVF